MKSLTVALDYSRSDQGAPVVLPFRVLDAEGAMIAEGATRSSDAASIEVPEGPAPLFVRLTWPSGRTETKRVGPSDTVNFNDQQIAQNEWSSWALPRLSPDSALIDPSPSSPPSAKHVGISQHDDNWMRLWRFAQGRWQERQLATRARQRSDDAIQLELDLDSAVWCLQVGGSRLPWVLVSLPGNGNCRILITPNDSSNPQALPLKVIVSGFRSDAEMLMEFLIRDAMRAARNVADFTGLALNLVNQKYSDPISAAAGAYFLLRTNGWRNIPDWWLDNLSNDFTWLPDGAIIRCVVLLRSGVHATERDRARKLLLEGLGRGVPVFAEGLSLLQEAKTLLQPREGTADDKAGKALSAKIRSLIAAEAWAGAAFSFLGADPDSPSAERVFGTPGKTRPAPKEKLTYFREIA